MCFSSRRAELETPVLFYLVQTFIKTKGSRNYVLVYNSISSPQKFVSKTGDVCRPALVRSLSNSREVFAPPLFSTSTKEPCHKHENQIIAKQVVKTCYSPEQEILIWRIRWEPLWKRILDAKIRKVFWEYASRGYGAWNPFWHWFDFSINQRVASFQWSINMFSTCRTWYRWPWWQRCKKDMSQLFLLGYILSVDYILQIWYLIRKKAFEPLTSLLQILSSQTNQCEQIMSSDP